MVVIGYDKILELIDKKKLIENVDKNNVQPSGVDLRVKAVYKLKKHQKGK
jgi:deoxycytidine triphosphate deaminase